ncbi:MAG TPA: complex I NDUFA9 subunit family protein [Gemmatimonadaceae bacterium]|nr:complex I NDUFA9 subunit family protein [Gemmatimonadaceae bacterium]
MIGYSDSGMRPDDGSFSVGVAEQPLPFEIDRNAPVVVTGAAGLVGTEVCKQLVADGWKVRAIVRDAAKAVTRFGNLSLEIRVSDIRNGDSMRAALTGAGALVHLAAIAIERPGQTYDEVNTEATRILLDAASAAGVDRIIYMSQNGADSSSPYAFLRSKGRAQDMVKASSLRWTILRPSVIFGPDDEFVNVLARMVRLSPFVFPLPGGGRARFQPIAVGDVARAVAKTLSDPRSTGQSYALGGPTPLTLRQMTERILIAMGTSRKLISAPVSAIRPLVAAAQKLLPSPPVTTSLLDLLEIDNVIEQNDLIASLGISPTPFAPEELLYLRNITAGGAFKSLFK